MQNEIHLPDIIITGYAYHALPQDVVVNAAKHGFVISEQTVRNEYRKLADAQHQDPTNHH